MTAKQTLIGPGLVNAHTHIYSGLAPLGMPMPKKPPQNFVQILEQIWWKLDRALDKDSLRASARLYVANSLLSGTTTLIDHHESPNFIKGSLDILADVCQELGIRALLCYGATDRNFGQKEGQDGLEECRRFIQSNKRSLVQGLIGLHASFTVSDETILKAGELCRELNTVLHIHLAEDQADVLDARKRGYPGPLERLRDLDALPKGSILAHCVHLDDEQVELAQKLGCWIVQNPRSNKGNNVGYPKALGHSDKVALGTDGFPADMCAERYFLFELAKENNEDMQVVERRTTAAWSLIKQHFGCNFAPVSEGTPADIGALEWSNDTVKAHNLCVAGKPVVKDGQLLTADINAINNEAKEQAKKLWQKMLSL